MKRASECTLFEKMARRRGQRKGHLIKRGPSWILRYWVDGVEIDPATGKPKRERVSVAIADCKGLNAIGKREAQRIATEEYLNAVNAGNMRPSSAKTLHEFYGLQFAQDYLPTLKPTGQAFFRSIVRRHILPTLGATRLRDITVERVQRLLTMKGREGLSTQTVVHVRNCLSAILRHAKNMQWFFGELPTEAVRLPQMKRAERRAPTWEQIDEAPKNTESQGLAMMRKHVRVWFPQIRLLLTYSDPEEGHQGTVYEADGWARFGMTGKKWGWGWNSRKDRRDTICSSKQRWVRTP